jgi:hypothetical protein
MNINNAILFKPLNNLKKYEKIITFSRISIKLWLIASANGI